MDFPKITLVVEETLLKLENFEPSATPRIHVEIFGRYSYGMPPKPKDWSRINMTATEFLKQTLG